ncbi:hypothetical protein JCM11957_13570 [Caminibacter profundus]
MRVGDLVIVASFGEIKAYKAAPRTLEAEAGLKPNEVKLDFLTAIDIIEAHQKVNELVSDNAGQFKGGSIFRGDFTRGSIGERYNLENEIIKEVIKAVAEDIDMLIEQNPSSRVFLSLPKPISNEVLEKIKNKDKIFRLVEKDLVKTDKNKLIEEFKAELLK